MRRVRRWSCSTDPSPEARTRSRSWSSSPAGAGEVSPCSRRPPSWQSGCCSAPPQPASAAENGPGSDRAAEQLDGHGRPPADGADRLGHRVDARGRRQHRLCGRQLLERSARGRRTGNEPHAAQQHPRVQPHHRGDHVVRPADQRPGEGHQGLARRVAHLRRRQLQLRSAARPGGTSPPSTPRPEPSRRRSSPLSAGRTSTPSRPRTPRSTSAASIQRRRGHRPQEPHRPSARTARCSAGPRPPTCRSTAWCSRPRTTSSSSRAGSGRSTTSRREASRRSTSAPVRSCPGPHPPR